MQFGDSWGNHEYPECSTQSEDRLPPIYQFHTGDHKGHVAQQLLALPPARCNGICPEKFAQGSEPKTSNQCANSLQNMAGWTRSIKVSVDFPRDHDYADILVYLRRLLIDFCHLGGEAIRSRLGTSCKGSVRADVR